MNQQLGLFDAPPRVVPVDLPVARPGRRPEVAYRHPDAPGMAWTGRGKPPRWVTDWVQDGKPLEALRVPGTQP